MGELVSNDRFVVKPVVKETGRSLDLARPHENTSSYLSRVTT